MIRVAVVDDHYLILDGLQRIFARSADIDLVGTFLDSADLLSHLTDLSPDVLITDLEGPNRDTLALVPALAKDSPATRVAVFTGSEDVDLFRQLWEAGVAAIELKTDDLDPADLVRMVHRGERYLSDDIAHLADG